MAARAQQLPSPIEKASVEFVVRYGPNGLGLASDKVRRERLTGQVILHFSQGSLMEVELLLKKVLDSQAKLGLFSEFSPQ